jgi:ribosomal protein S27E
MSKGTRSGSGVAVLIGAIVDFIIAAIMLFFGVLFILGSGSPEYGDPGWLTTGIVLVVIALVLIAGGIVVLMVTRPKPPQEIVQKIDLSGDMGMAKLKCKNCGAELDKNSIVVKEGAIFVSCPFCGSTYQMVEEPKW